MKNVLVRTIAGLLLLLAFASPTVAQIVPEQNLGYERTDSVQLVLPDSLVAAPVVIDSVQLAWLRTPPTMRDLVADRIGCLETDVPHLFNNTVMSFVNYFTINNRAYTQRILERENLYFPLFEKYLAKYNLPKDLKYLAVVESALVPQARSRVGAVGLWQFMGPTANDFRLVRNDYIDERMNPEKSTEAACRFLRDLYRMFGDWELALSAYNYGSGNIMKAIRRAGGQRNFWAIYPYLPKETRNYVPTFTAALYTLKYAHEHGLHSDSLHYLYPEPTDTLIISGRSLDLRKFSAQFGLDSTEIARHNPEIKKAYLPETLRNYRLTVPACIRPELAAVDRTTLLDFCKVTVPPPALLMPRFPSLLDATATQPMLAATAPQADVRYRRVRHSVRRGENLASVAEQYNVTSTQIARWNNLRRGRALTLKQQLVVYLPTEQPSASASTSIAIRKLAIPTTLPLFGGKEAVATRKSIREPAVAVAAQKDSDAVAKTVPAPVKSAPIARVAKEPTSTPALLETAASLSTDSALTTYSVQRGDNLDKIARAHGMTASQLMALNHLRSANLSIGQKLVFYGSEEEESLPEPVVASNTNLPAAPARATAKASTKPATAPLPKIHLVQPGDTLYNISRRYHGVTVEQLRKLNHLKSDEVKPGQKLVLEQS
ncbi:LysM peptidoglycan-binding domain-containing protein [Hymenobacter sp. GOD-10R]|uniref:LysM peptidoglycan-binding domain-containing protein n=1 Tax=Hymenobacter sp. GOD-10R TaxID=3093922 RepID=UPI002D787F5D|nr:LysM peptidoglycan-binding domain-containing protein [Hymenobacter sp. GOD-10R]WRQ29223.1 LysM peptidoglycan-binding domain-containing protein [Hymenobacter sp. GOD-10R]